MRRSTNKNKEIQGFWFDIYKASHVAPDNGKPTALFRLDAVGVPKSWPRVTGATLEEAVTLASEEYSRFCARKRKKNYPFGNPDLEPYNPAALGCVFVRITSDKPLPEPANS
jgi:hypothetical protein